MAYISSPDSPTPFEVEEDLLHYYVVDGVRLPPFCRGKLDDIANFTVREDDVWILSYPRAGGWIQDMVHLIHSEGGDILKADLSLEAVEDAIPFLEGPSPGLETLKNLPSPRCFKSHLPFRLLPRGVQDKQCKVIYVARNPKDVMCSFYDFHRTVQIIHYKGTFQQFYYRFMNSKLGYGCYFSHVKSWWNQRTHPSVFFLKYEDMHKEFKKTVIKMGEFLGQPLTSDKVLDVCAYWDEEAKYNRKEDRVGYWKYHFTIHINEKFEKLYPDKLKDSDLTFDFDL
ncbi:putative sulfotransferase 4A1 [Apostichopus japonicus]|uniref:Putative sulfotransferase 4A1 n=2 Tax=Stichopus japonicus TaxID=307972 RepID=A0A2G8KT55_STIJA|nr:putative sulfotransferase 4A1 [Apostichopus japonicus]